MVQGSGPRGGPWTGFHRGDPWTGSTEVVHGPGPQGWSMDPGPCFVYVPKILHGECFVNKVSKSEEKIKVSFDHSSTLSVA